MAVLQRKATAGDYEWISPDGSGVADLDDLENVNITTPSNGQVLTYDSTAQEWKNGNASSGGHTIETNTGVDLTSRGILKVGSSLTATDDSTNEKTIIDADTDASLDDILPPSVLPSVMDYDNFAPTEDGTTSTSAYNINDLFVHSGQLYKATDNISIGDTITPNTNCEVTSFSEQISDVNSDLAEKANKPLASVSVTADGVMTNRQLLDSLYALINWDNVGTNSHIKYGASIYQMCDTQGRFASVRIGYITEIDIKASNSVFMYSTNMTTPVDQSTAIPISGIVITFVYGLN